MPRIILFYRVLKRLYGQAVKLIFSFSAYIPEWLSTMYPISKDQAIELQSFTRSIAKTIKLCEEIKTGRSYIDVIEDYKKSIQR